MSESPRALLLDADGVCIESRGRFSEKYAADHGVDPTEFIKFFTGPFQDALRGKADLKDLIRKHTEIWRWNENPDDILQDWFEFENHTNKELVGLVATIKSAGMPVFLATNQEKYRADYLKNIMFPGVFTGVISSSEVGYVKDEPAFWMMAIGRLATSVPGIIPEEILYYDDSESGVLTAAEVGIVANVYESPLQLIRALKLRNVE